MEEVFMLFINENILRQVAKYTNVYAQKYSEANAKNPNDLTPVDLCQIKVVVGLFLFGVYRSQHKSLCLLWSSDIFGRFIFPAAFELNRFEQIAAYLRFDIQKKLKPNRRICSVSSILESVYRKLQKILRS